MNNSYNFSMRNPILTANTSVNPYNQPTTRLTLEQQAYQQPFQQVVPQSNPYTDYMETFNSFSTLTQRKIQEDSRYTDIYSQCQSALLHEAFSQVMPTVLSTQSGRTLFEKLNITTKTLGEEYTQAELNREKEIAEREKATEAELKNIELQKQELAQMLAQIKELQSTLLISQPAEPLVAAQNAPVQQQIIQPTQDYPTQQNATQANIELVAQSQNNSQYQNNQQNQNNQNYQQKNKSRNGGNS